MSEHTDDLPLGAYGPEEPMNVVECKSCMTPIVWMKTERGKNMPVDAESVADTGATVFDPDQGMVSHFATCPQGKQWSGKGKP